MLRQSPNRLRAALLISGCLYVVACALPATEIWVIHDSSASRPRVGTRTATPAAEQRGSEYYETVRGITCLTYGWLQLLGGGLTWLANPFALAALGLLVARRRSGAKVFAVAGLSLALSYTLIPPEVNGHDHVMRVGAWLWLGSLFVLTIAALGPHEFPPQPVAASIETA